MRNIWVRFGCFLTGYNYNILRGCSEAAVKSVKKYTAAILIVCILWFFIGFTFAQRYLTSSFAGCLTAGIIAVIIIIQIERQIVLSIKPGKLLQTFRISLAFLMSLLGAVIIDQILLEKDIELEKISYIAEKVDALLPRKTAELKAQIAALDSSINNKEAEKQKYILETASTPFIQTFSTQTEDIRVPTKTLTASGKDSIAYTNQRKTTIIKNPIANPKSALIKPLDSVINIMRQQKTEKDNDLLHIRPALEKEMAAKTGFLDELKVMVRLISGSNVALFFWLLWIFFFLSIELLVLVSKMSDKANDYEKAVLHHMNVQIQRLEVFAKGFERTTQ